MVARVSGINRFLVLGSSATRRIQQGEQQGTPVEGA
jgi:methyl coenzyme M reductase subunit D